MRPPFRSLALLGALACVLALTGVQPILAQTTYNTTRIVYKPLQPTATGIGGDVVYGISDSSNFVDSAWTALKANGGVLGTDLVYSASLITAVDSAHFVSGPVSFVDGYGPVPATTVAQFQQAALSPIRFTVKREMTDTGTVAIFTPHGAPFITTGVIIVGGNDTSGFNTTNAITKIGGNASTYDNIVASLVPPLGKANTLTGTLVSPRTVTAAGTTIYWHVTTAAVATTETAEITLIGNYIR